MEDSSDSDKKSAEITENGKKPQITSTDPSERKAARALRIIKRQEALKRQEIIAEDNGLEGEESISAVEKQAAECAALLEHLLADGEERVTNIRVASDAREVNRRFTEAKKRQELLGKLEAEANLAQEKFEEISSQWSIIIDMNDPLDIEEEINLQKQRCYDLIVQKNDIISELKKELKKADETFYKDLKKQLNDIKLLGERIDSQVVLMKNAYQSQLALIEQSIEIEQATTIKNNEERWTALYDQRDQAESENTNVKVAQVSEFSNKMDALNEEHREKYRLAKIKLETEIQALQNEFQELKRNCLINTEKMDYNYQILKRREEENLLIRTQQKRRLNKMQDLIGELKTKIIMTNKRGAIDDAKANKEIQRLQNSLLELQTKFNHFANVNDKKYQQVWKMNHDKATKLIKNINDTDKLIHEQILDLDWTPPKMDLLKQTDLVSYKNANITVTDSCNKMDNNSSRVELDVYHIRNRKLVQRLLYSIADSSGFLIEERLWPLLEKYETVPTTLCKLDNIFNALDVTDEADMKILFQYFVQYAYCHRCKFEENEAIGTEYDVSSTSIKCKCGHPLDIIPGDALSGIRDFVASMKIRNKSSQISPTSLNTVLISRSLTEKDVSLYWEKYTNVFSSQKEKLWDNIIIGLNKYLPILQDRHKLHKEVLHLRKQNTELKNLLRGHDTNNETFKQKYLTPLQTEFKIAH
ncbi:dynein regulatory complex protein 1-like [Arctopsyche grandis]|uniref:dynein regulatory complex protein 1-like n=1 Tax=Arctopsyche grandis TaxID=121162 RepID=UPI00406D6E19